MSPAELARELAAGRVRPAYLILGGEALLRDEALAALRMAVLGAPDAEFDLERLSGERTGAGELADALRALPLFAKRRLVVLRDPEARRGKAGEALAEALEQGLARDRGSGALHARRGGAGPRAPLAAAEGVPRARGRGGV